MQHLIDIYNDLLASFQDPYRHLALSQETPEKFGWQVQLKRSK